MKPQSRVRFAAEVDMLLGGAHLPAGLKAAEGDIEHACSDWLQSNPETLPTAIVFRSFVTRAIRERVKNAEAPSEEPAHPAFTRTNGKMSIGEEAYLNAGKAIAGLEE